MCLDPSSIKKYKNSKDWIEGYKILKWRDGWEFQNLKKGWYSVNSLQRWEFAEMVEAQVPKQTLFEGISSSAYKKGIHAFKTFRATNFLYNRTVKVLLFGVTHTDSGNYRADRAIIIEVLNGVGKRIPW